MTILTQVQQTKILLYQSNEPKNKRCMSVLKGYTPLIKSNVLYYAN